MSAYRRVELGSISMSINSARCTSGQGLSAGRAVAPGIRGVRGDLMSAMLRAPAQHMRALQRANAVRVARAELKRDVDGGR